MKAPLILVPSDRMDSNKKKDRNEHGLIRMGQKARENLGLANDKTVELWPNSRSDDDRINRSRVLEIFQAYSADLKKAKQSMPEEDYLRVGFVTTSTFSYICKDGRKRKEDIWIADKISDTFIGGDPEFVLFNDNAAIQYASEVLSHEDVLGSDGPLAELRPRPAVEVEDFVKRIKDIFRKDPNTKLIEQLDWVAGCIYMAPRAGDPEGGTREWPVGGHIHIGTPIQLAKKVESMKSRNVSMGGIFVNAVFACLNRVLDELLAIPLIKVDGEDNTIERRKHYGYFGGYKTERDRLEYRSLSGEWLSHPRLATAVLGTAKAIAHSYFLLLEEMNFGEESVMTPSQRKRYEHGRGYLSLFNTGFDGWKDIPMTAELGTTLSNDEMVSRMNAAEIEFNKSYYNKLSRMLKSLPTYSEYSNHIDLFLEIVALPYRVFRDMDRNLKNTWVDNSDFVI